MPACYPTPRLTRCTKGSAVTYRSAPRQSTSLPAPTASGSIRRGAIRLAVLATAGALLLAPVDAFAMPSADLAKAKMLYESKCGACHSLDENRIGPKHRGVVGRKVASVSDYDYSPALKKLGGVWTPERLDKWLQSPQALAPGSKMFFQVPDPAQRKAIIAYLAANSPPPK